MKNIEYSFSCLLVLFSGLKKRTLADFLLEKYLSIYTLQITPFSTNNYLVITIKGENNNPRLKLMEDLWLYR